MADGWYSAAELALLKLPGLPGTERAIRTRAERHLWQNREREKSGGGREYPIAALPKPAQQAIANRTLQALPVTAPTPLVAVEDLKHFQRKPMQARAAILAQIDLMVASGLTRAKSVEAFVEAAKSGTLPGDVQRRIQAGNARSGASGRTVSRATLFNWLRQRDQAKGDVAALAPKPAKESPVPAWAPTFMALYARPTAPNLTEVLANWPAQEIAPSYDQARGFVKRLDVITRNAGRLGPRALRSMKAYIQRDSSNLWPGAVFVGDGHTFKAEIAHPAHGRPFRPEITAILDVFTRRWVGWSVDLAENTWSVADALRHAFVTATVCDIWYYDNGAGANNRMWDDDVAGLTGRLHITKVNSAPWSSQARGVIERFHSSTLHPVARTLPTYVGDRMDKEARQKAFKITRKDIKAMGTSPLLMPWVDFVAEMDVIQAAYNNRPHSTLPSVIDAATGKRRDMTPNEMWDAAVAGGWQADRLTPELARDLFRPAVVRTVERGLVRLFNNAYFHPVLEGLHGEAVTVGYDLHDASKVVISLPDGRFLCEAEWNANRRDYFPIPFAESARQKRIGGIVKRHEGHIGVALEESTVKILDQAGAPAPSDREIEHQSRFEAEFLSHSAPSHANAPEASATAEIVQLETRETRFARALAIQRQLETDDDSVSADDLRWLARYQNQPEYRSMMAMYEDFGDAVLTA